MQENYIVQQLKTFGLTEERAKSCLTSRDAIIPVIEKQSNQLKVKIGVILEELVCRDSGCDQEIITIIMVVLASPSQLCEALLRATGKWKD